MRIRVNEIKEDSVVAADVFSKTNRPIIPKKAIINEDIINVLKAFMISEIEVEKNLHGGTLFGSGQGDQDVKKQEKEEEMGISNLFLQSVSQFKKEFHSWQAGLPIDISKIRALLMPLLEVMDKFPKEIFHLYRLSSKEDYIYQHPVAVGVMCGFIGKKINLEKGEWLQLALAGCLADCGMAKVSPRILKKKSSLTVQEYEEIKKHPIYSYKMVQNISVLRKEVKLAILEHHERLDGSGYPLGEKEKRIHQYAKVIAIVDIFHAMTSDRFYKKRQSPFKVLEMILNESFGKYDFNIVKVMCFSIINFGIGDRVSISDGRQAEIIFVDEKMPTRPIIKMVETQEVINLALNRNLYIEEVKF